MSNISWNIHVTDVICLCLASQHLWTFGNQSMSIPDFWGSQAEFFKGIPGSKAIMAGWLAGGLQEYISHTLP